MTSTPAYDELVSLLYSEEERRKFEWAIGAAICGAPTKIVVFCGPPMSGKSTVMKIIQKIFASSAVIIQHDGLSKIEDSFMFVGVNAPLKTSGMRPADAERLIEVQTTGLMHQPSDYYRLMAEVNTELNEIALRCLETYQALGPNYYDSYRLSSGNNNVQENSK